MSVLAIVLDDANREEMEGWASYIAEALAEPLDFVRVVEGGGRELAFEGEESGVRTATVSPESAAHSVAEHIKTSKLQLLVTDQRGGRRGLRASLVRRWLESSHCDTLCMRFAKDGGRGGGKVLVPTSGGANSRVALALALKLAAHDDDGGVEPLLVEADVDELSAEVGRARLDGILARSGINLASDRIIPRVELGSRPDAAIHRAAEEGDYDLILLGASGVGELHRLLFGTLPERLLKSGERAAVGVFRRAIPLRQRLRQAAERWLHLRVPQLDRETRVALFENLETNARWSFDFMVLICLSTALAGFGLMLDSAAVVIGAMLVAPLMTPLLGAGLALVQGNLPLMRHCARSILFGFCAALFIGVTLGLAGSFYGLTHQMKMRGSPDIPDMVVAFLSGLAASYCIARPRLSSALAGVAIAAALVPPIATAGITLAMGEPGVARGAALLFGTNVVFIILGAAFNFYAAGVRARTPGKEDDGGAVWARRVLLVLMAAGAVLAIPLGSVLIDKIAGADSADRELNVATEVSTERRLRGVFESTLKKLGGGGELRGLVVRDVGKEWRLEVNIRAEEGVGPELEMALLSAATENLKKPVALQLSTERYRELRSELGEE